VGELEGAVVKRGATRVVLKDGRTIVGMSVLRTELLEGIALLKAAGLPEQRQPARTPPALPTSEESQDARVLMAEIEKLLQPPMRRFHLSRVGRLAVALARSSKRGEVANLAMRLLSAVHAAGDESGPASAVEGAFARLRAALEQEQNQSN
jgi:hypothetical protein